MSQETSDTDKGSRAADAVQHPWFEKLARAGHVVNGVLHILIGYIAIRLAFGKGGNADQSGALGELASKPGGAVALWVAVAAFVMLALWRLVETVGGKASESDSGDAFDKVKALSLAVVYFAFAWTAFTFARGSGKSSSEQNVGLTARLMENGFGKFVLIVAGGVVIGVGGYFAYKGATKKFLKDLLPTRSRYAEPIGFVGYIAKGAALLGVGTLIITAVVTADPAKAKGLDGAIKILGEQAFGTALLVIAGLGIAVYGVYSFVMAKDARM
ncbi:DUF1206 domain-containing protein [Antrihabitans sp. YC2-6]|uniref:DUF1206 domain-containing protein n=1 Tax=Antrihabitans sp. YC2-6 TaxID=2799498 RepID=UPI0018F56A01|nr:DUF1206 domain-containing protein [Antrihabitans sp. YC2-6]MBJ8347887.1 DUF1206 domain-containing protein [Antrihabitans sp. YC2-6]